MIAVCNANVEYIKHNNRRCRKVRDSERDMCLKIDVIKAETDREAWQVTF